MKEVDKVNGEKVENCNTIKDRTGKLVVAEDNVQKTWREYFEDLYNMDTEEQVSVGM